MRKIFIVVLIVMAAALVGYYFGFDIGFERAINLFRGADDGIASTRTYTNSDVGFSFSYRSSPDGYVESHIPSDDAFGFKGGVILYKETDWNELQASDIPREGPPGIIVEVFENPGLFSAREWATENPRSNYGLSFDGTVQDIMQDSVMGVRYSFDGLYAAEAVVFVYNENIIMMTVSYFEKNDGRIDDFNAFLDTLMFGGIETFEDCVRAGFPVMESYPRQCRDDNGNMFTEFVGNELEKTDLIRIDSPRPNQGITSPLTLTGEARGVWYFEASFPIILTDWDGRIIAEHYAEAQSEWMTENFVPFEGVLEFEKPYSDMGTIPDFMKRGTLILKKDNPSGLPEHDDALEIPILFE